MNRKSIREVSTRCEFCVFFRFFSGPFEKNELWKNPQHAHMLRSSREAYEVRLMMLGWLSGEEVKSRREGGGGKCVYDDLVF